MTDQLIATKRVDLGAFVARRASQLQNEYLENRASAVAVLAKLRHGVALPLGANIELIGLTTAGLERDDQSLPDAPTPRERAAYAALTLFALHQQAHRSRRMHREGYSMGRSARLLGKHSHAEEAVRRRFNELGTATEWNEIVHHARGLVTQFRAFDIPLDYGRLARDLLSLQSAESALHVRNAWGRDFYRTNSPEESGEPPVAGDDEPSGQND